MQIRGTQCPSASRALPSLPSAAPHSCGWKAGTRGHVAPAPPLPSPFARKGAQGRRLPFPWPPPCTRGKGAREARDPPAPPFPLGHAAPLAWNGGVRRQDARKGDTQGHATPRPLPSPFARKGYDEGRPPRPLPLPSSRHPVRAERGHVRHDTPWPLPCPFARKGGARGHTAPPLRVAPTLSPFSPRATRHARHATPPFPLGRAAPYARGSRGHATPGSSLPHSHAAPGIPSPLAAPPRTRGKGACEAPPPGATLPPFARKGVARGYAAGHLPSPFAAPPGTREKGAREGIRAEWGARGHAAPFAREGAHEAKPTPPPYVSRSGAGAVSVRPRSPRHSTT
ncbi:hypothetical protein EDB84DRAFT_1565499 [Lactarius hengduanensis]|nr:hypothetical protein EDB84DRAFT_1565499 [Lactarius hengduanensis]